MSTPNLTIVPTRPNNRHRRALSVKLQLRLSHLLADVEKARGLGLPESSIDDLRHACGRNMAEDVVGASDEQVRDAIRALAGLG